MQRFYFTFGQTHLHPDTKQPMKDYWVEVEAESYIKARQLFMSKYGKKWAFQYNETDFGMETRVLFPRGKHSEIIQKKETE